MHPQRSDHPEAQNSDPTKQIILVNLQSKITKDMFHPPIIISGAHDQHNYLPAAKVESAKSSSMLVRETHTQLLPKSL